MNHVIEANDLWMGVPVQSEDHFWGEIGSVQFYCMLSRFRAVGALGAVVHHPPVFCRPVDPILTRGEGQIMPTTLLRTPVFSDLPTALKVCDSEMKSTAT